MTKQISLTLLAAAAMLSMACEKKHQVARCVDDTGHVVPDERCDHPVHITGGYGPYMFYRWYYGGSGYFPGEFASQGSFQPASGLQPVRASSPEGQSIIRGGFGSGFFGGGG